VLAHGALQLKRNSIALTNLDTIPAPVVIDLAERVLANATPRPLDAPVMSAYWPFASDIFPQKDCC